MKIGFISRWFLEEHRRSGGKGGTEQERVRAYQKLGHEVTVFSQTESSRFGDVSDINGVRVVATHRTRRKWFLAIFDKCAKKRTPHRKLVSDCWELGKLLKQHGPFDVLEAQCEEPDGLVLAALSKVQKLPPWCVQLFALRYNFKEGQPQFTEKKLFKFIFEQAGLLKANSALVASHLIQDYGCAKEKIRIVHPNVALPANIVARPPDDETTLLCIGALNETKGIAYFIEALGSLFASSAGELFKVHDVKFKIAGGGDPKDRYVVYLKKLQRYYGLGAYIEWLGQVPPDQLAEEVQKSSVVIIPSLFDAWNRAAIEAICLERPVIITDKCGAASWVEEQAAGIVVPAANGEKIAEAIIDLYHQRHEVVDKMRRPAMLAREQFNNEAIGRAGVEVFEELLRSRPKNG
ncbi:MAG: glycosyltransferase family 4 protein [Verrucomicrobiales bacterium]